MADLLFIAHSYHKKTRSCDFMIDYLKEFYSVDVVYNDSWERGGRFDWSIINDSYKTVVFWQLTPDRDEMKNIKHKNMIFFPMYDQSGHWSFRRWRAYKDCKIVCFSKKLYKKLQKFKMDSIYVQYFIKPDKYQCGNFDEAFFWFRRPEITLDKVIKVLSKNTPKIHLHRATDGCEFIKPDPDIEKKFNITYTEWFDTKEEMADCIAKKGLYIAPRVEEGIGMSFLEAMSMGKIIIAHNAPTMNEYIKDGVNGFLCDFNKPCAINLKDLEKVSKNAYESACMGYEKWEKDKRTIIDFIESERKDVSINPFCALIYSVIYKH